MVDEKQDNEIPYFVKIRGCINCDASKNHKKETGFDYGFDHESMFFCIALCGNYGFSLVNPFFDPEEAVRLAKKGGSPETIEGTKKYYSRIKEQFGKYYEKMGVPLDEIIRRLG